MFTCAFNVELLVTLERPKGQIAGGEAAKVTIGAIIKIFNYF